MPEGATFPRSGHCAKEPIGWIPEIGGLRALAVLAVLFNHAFPRVVGDLAVGNMGVAAFFSISGFLAYVVLDRDEKRLKKISYSYFIFRRVLRIWPAYFAVIAFGFLLAWMITGPVQ